ncbi:TrkH family potassium uptake protein [Pelagicoccus sp. SDUM812003]|uniref:TrkH family potassium uptake protein n=1 Tax=Pelagicoccus sp. SDUM812003 TaxID=3041267 RepID=UPI00280D8ABA|nr:TrkH family potassium uptake protein [Pelagicoccus sp. SDUM812003]MDQ8202826.1 TrkH family potassium uptake protein [Pelagicoccus sp. SDUM812003]
MNFPLVSRLIGVAMLILAMAFFLCIGVSFFMDSPEHAAITHKAFYTACGISMAAATAFLWIGRRHTKKFFRKEALATIGIAWLLASLVGSVPYVIALPDATLADAIFESSSGLTTTGASVFTDLESFPPSIMFWRCLSQWIGGMGVVVFFVAVLGFIGVGGKMLYAGEASGSVAEFEESRIQSTVGRLVWVYLGLSVACCLSYHFAGMGWFDAINHSFTTVSTAGFSTRTDSFAAFQSPAIEWVSIVFMSLAGLNFLFILRLCLGKFHLLRRNTEFRVYFSLLLGSSALVSAYLMLDGTAWDAEHAIRAGTFQVVSIMTTTGFATEDFAQWSALPQMLLLLLMVLGGCTGSTAGGIKISRVVIAARMSLLSIERSFRTRVVRQIKINGIVLGPQPLADVVNYLILIGGVISSSMVVVAIFETTHQVDTCLSVVYATLFNVGPGIAEVGPTENFGFLHSHTKIFLSLLMIMGRLELYAILALFSPSLWKRFS